ncbi:hypothetical protein [Kitasatospora sp. DSM 101779]|uniref:hypothetical protein n=1 Tax=Kitasatospora sp. DSM 101779 TaxID=2853165 RepID=UPI0021DB37D9|nr:hypothetical protein [Kitasatospora sp. DSM 101779]MCU7820927.1 hypothetical protein [Kitasatospora sp. DSM 101779]
MLAVLLVGLPLLLAPGPVGVPYAVASGGTVVDLPRAEETHRRVLAVLEFLRS